jgi:hypothetical protein
MLLSGVLVAGGLILAAFTVQGYLDPNWAQRQLAAAAGQQERSAEPKTVNAFHSRSRFIASTTETRSPPAKPPIVKASVRPSKAAEAPPTDPKASTKRHLKKKAVERTKEPPPPPQRQASAFQWPWKLFGN